MGFWTKCKQSAPLSRQVTTPTPHHSIFTGRVLFLAPNQQCQSTEGTRMSAVTMLQLSWVTGIRLKTMSTSQTCACCQNSRWSLRTKLQNCISHSSKLRLHNMQWCPYWSCHTVSEIFNIRLHHIVLCSAVLPTISKTWSYSMH